MATYAELQAQIAALQEQAEQLRVSEIKSALAQIKELMEKNGITTADLQDGMRKTRKASSVAAQYRDPVSKKTWSGRGRAPKWLEGKNRDEFRI